MPLKRVVMLSPCLIGLRAGRRDAESPTTRRIREEQLQNLYAPLERTLNLNTSSDIRGTLAQLQIIISENIVLVPPVILNKFLEISAADNPTGADISELRKVVSSFFNWTRKSAGYPYDSSVIKRDWIPTSARNSVIGTVIVLAGLLLWAVCAFVTLMLLTGGSSNLSPTLAQLCILVASVGTVPIAILYSQSKNC